ncbi:dTDP-4-dehydrorhamnose 3,5-epimerase family protein [Diaminobutyricimonas sp. TR449]|uniref:dTDP-4-dehydrorhamnose 3,5-epimerase family protein n=1 Tax=Diaminobutyricimonas sp. TR449 TaxID=2708076 RepID=UPI0014236454|nr:dTDP-4-dehydrorhamnose 3,5-epimerase family protein [Diaminobutyricimonas sp. TR449]
MQIRELSISGAYEVTPRQFADTRGLFLESYRVEPWVELIGSAPQWVQANTSVSHRGVVRGVHYGPPQLRQAKYVSVVRGAAVDYVVDLRPESPTFGQWDSVLLDTVDRRSVYIPAGFGHAFESLEDDTTLHYLLTAVYTPASEFSINVFDSTVALSFKSDESDLVLSERDREAPNLSESLRQAGMLRD